MKAQDLRLPFKYEERQPIIMQKLWYVPERVPLTSLAFPGWDSKELFGNTNPVHVEYCSGNGAWILEKAKNNPHINFLAVELRFDRARKIWTKIHNLTLPNIVVAWAEGLLLTETYIPAGSVDRIYINFPDPWPKRRHERLRLIKEPFISQMGRILKKTGDLIFVTDDVDYSESVIRDFAANPLFESCLPTPFHKEPEEHYGNSFFNELWKSKGKSIRLHQYKPTLT